MDSSPTTEAQVTIVVVPRERFSFTRESLESIYEHTDYPMSLIYVDGGSPLHIQRYLETQACEKGFKLIRTDHYLSPNGARNLGLRHVRSKYVVFIDNDVIVTPGWLKRLVQAAEETGAAVLGPLTCIGKPLHEKIHNPGGKTYIAQEEVGTRVRRRIYQNSDFSRRRVTDVRDQLLRTQCDYVEFHCMLARTEIFEQTGPLDEELLSTREHIDFCMTVSRLGGSIYCEREAIVTYVPGPPFEWSDLPFFMLRWSDAWNLASLKHFSQKWDLIEDEYFKTRYRNLQDRRRKAYIRSLSHRLAFGRHVPWLERILMLLERPLNRHISNRYTQS